jgi:hypothetical protein
LAAHSPQQKHAKEQHRITTAAKARSTHHARPQEFAPLASIGGGPSQPDGTGPAVVATLAALLAGFAMVTGRWLRLSLRRRAHPPRHAHPAPASGGHRRPRGHDNDWNF